MPKHQAHQSAPRSKQDDASRNPPDQLDPKNDYNKVGPLSMQGVEASQFPGEGRGTIETDPGHQGKRNLPQNTGNITGNVGLRGTPNLSEADTKGGRKKN